MCVYYLLVIGGPDTTGNLAFQVDLGGPVSLPADWSHQNKAISVGDKSLGAIVGPGEVTHLKRAPDTCVKGETAECLNLSMYTISCRLTCLFVFLITIFLAEMQTISNFKYVDLIMNHDLHEPRACFQFYRRTVNSLLSRALMMASMRSHFKNTLRGNEECSL